MCCSKPRPWRSPAEVQQGAEGTGNVQNDDAG